MANSSRVGCERSSALAAAPQGAAQVTMTVAGKPTAPSPKPPSAGGPASVPLPSSAGTISHSSFQSSEAANSRGDVAASADVAATRHRTLRSSAGVPLFNKASSSPQIFVAASASGGQPSGEVGGQRQQPAHDSASRRHPPPPSPSPLSEHSYGATPSGGVFILNPKASLRSATTNRRSSASGGHTLSSSSSSGVVMNGTRAPGSTRTTGQTTSTTVSAYDGGDRRRAPVTGAGGGDSRAAANDSLQQTSAGKAVRGAPASSSYDGTSARYVNSSAGLPTAPTANTQTTTAPPASTTQRPLQHVAQQQPQHVVQPSRDRQQLPPQSQQQMVAGIRSSSEGGAVAMHPLLAAAPSPSPHITSSSASSSENHHHHRAAASPASSGTSMTGGASGGASRPGGSNQQPPDHSVVVAMKSSPSAPSSDTTLVVPPRVGAEALADDDEASRSRKVTLVSRSDQPQHSAAPGVTTAATTTATAAAAAVGPSGVGVSRGELRPQGETASEGEAAMERDAGSGSSEDEDKLQSTGIVGAVKVRDGLFMGDAFASVNAQFILANKVGHIVNCCPRRIGNFYEWAGVQYLAVDMLRLHSPCSSDGGEDVVSSLTSSSDGDSSSSDVSSSSSDECINTSDEAENDDQGGKDDPNRPAKTMLKSMAQRKKGSTKKLGRRLSVIPTEGPLVDTFFNFIEAAAQGGGSCLIHSEKGQSRPACLLAVYFMRKYRWSLNKALQFLYSRRADIIIPPHQLSNLHEYEVSSAQGSHGQFTYSVDWATGSETISNDELILQNTFLNSLSTGATLSADDLSNENQNNNTTSSAPTRNGKLLTWGDLRSPRTPSDSEGEEQQPTASAQYIGQQVSSFSSSSSSSTTSSTKLASTPLAPPTAREVMTAAAEGHLVIVTTDGRRLQLNGNISEKVAAEVAADSRTLIRRRREGGRRPGSGPANGRSRGKPHNRSDGRPLKSILRRRHDDELPASPLRPSAAADGHQIVSVGARSEAQGANGFGNPINLRSTPLRAAAVEEPISQGRPFSHFLSQAKNEYPPSLSSTRAGSGRTNGLEGRNASNGDDERKRESSSSSVEKSSSDRRPNADNENSRRAMVNGFSGREKHDEQKTSSSSSLSSKFGQGSSGKLEQNMTEERQNQRPSRSSGSGRTGDHSQPKHVGHNKSASPIGGRRGSGSRTCTEWASTARLPLAAAVISSANGNSCLNPRDAYSSATICSVDPEIRGGSGGSRLRTNSTSGRQASQSTDAQPGAPHTQSSAAAAAALQTVNGSVDWTLHPELWSQLHPKLLTALIQEGVHNHHHHGHHGHQSSHRNHHDQQHSHHRHHGHHHRHPHNAQSSSAAPQSETRSNSQEGVVMTAAHLQRSSQAIAEHGGHKISKPRASTRQKRSASETIVQTKYDDDPRLGTPPRSAARGETDSKQLDSNTSVSLLAASAPRQSSRRRATSPDAQRKPSSRTRSSRGESNSGARSAGAKPRTSSREEVTSSSISNGGDHQLVGATELTNATTSPFMALYRGFAKYLESTPDDTNSSPSRQRRPTASSKGDAGPSDADGGDHHKSHRRLTSPAAPSPASQQLAGAGGGYLQRTRTVDGGSALSAEPREDPRNHTDLASRGLERVFTGGARALNGPAAAERRLSGQLDSHRHHRNSQKENKEMQPVPSASVSKPHRLRRSASESGNRRALEAAGDHLLNSPNSRGGPSAAGGLPPPFPSLRPAASSWVADGQRVDDGEKRQARLPPSQQQHEGGRPELRHSQTTTSVRLENNEKWQQVGTGSSSSTKTTTAASISGGERMGSYSRPPRRSEENGVDANAGRDRESRGTGSSLRDKEERLQQQDSHKRHHRIPTSREDVLTTRRRRNGDFHSGEQSEYAQHRSRDRTRSAELAGSESSNWLPVGTGHYTYHPDRNSNNILFPTNPSDHHPHAAYGSSSATTDHGRAAHHRRASPAPSHHMMEAEPSSSRKSAIGSTTSRPAGVPVAVPSKPLVAASSSRGQRYMADVRDGHGQQITHQGVSPLATDSARAPSRNALVRSATISAAATGDDLTATAGDTSSRQLARASSVRRTTSYNHHGHQYAATEDDAASRGHQIVWQPSNSAASAAPLVLLSSAKPSPPQASDHRQRRPAPTMTKSKASTAAPRHSSPPSHHHHPKNKTLTSTDDTSQQSVLWRLQSSPPAVSVPRAAPRRTVSSATPTDSPGADRRLY